MSETKETIEERYQEVVRMFGVWRGSGDITTAGREFIAVLLKDLMAEREKLKELVEVPPGLSSVEAGEYFVSMASVIRGILCPKED